MFWSSLPGAGNLQVTGKPLPQFCFTQGALRAFPGKEPHVSTTGTDEMALLASFSTTHLFVFSTSIANSFWHINFSQYIYCLL